MLPKCLHVEGFAVKFPTRSGSVPLLREARHYGENVSQMHFKRGTAWPGKASTESQ